MAASDSKSRDFWDKADVVAKFLSSVVIAIIGLLITWSIQNTQIKTNEGIAKAQIDASRRKADDDRRLQESQITVQLVNHLISEDATQRQIAIIALRQSVPNSTYDAIVEVLAKTDPSQAVRVAAISQLATSTRPQVAKTLSSIATDPTKPPNERSLAAKATERVAISSGFDSGTYVFAATSDNEPAYEDSALRSGVFTHFLVRGLTGEADLDQNEVVTASELQAFLGQRVATYTQTSFGRSQHPVFATTGITGLKTSVLGDLENRGDVVAVVVGISRYGSPVVPTLQFAASDANSIAKTIIGKAGIRPNNVFILTDEDATRARILEQLNRAAKITKPTSTFLVYFSGHAQVDTAQGTVNWLTYDSDAARPESTFLNIDDVKRALVRSEAGSKFLFVDTSHAGASAVVMR